MTTLENVRKVITERVGTGQILTIQPGGNFGDSLIYKGANKFFQDENINTVPLRSANIRHDSPPPIGFGGVEDMYMTFKNVVYQLPFIRRRITSDISAVYIHGGGNFNDIWGDGVRCFRAAARYFDVPIIVGPQSVNFTRTDPREIFKRTENEVHFFCREEYSYEIIDRAGTDNVNTHLEEDTALYLTADDLPVGELADRYSLVSFRTDRESNDPMVDRSVDPPILIKDISVNEDGFDGFVETTANAEQIYTDRLHVAILSTILGKPVRFYENAYHKNRGVYETSLSDKENVDFVYTQA